MGRSKKGRQLSLAARRELIQAIGDGIGRESDDKEKILDEFVEVTGFHREHAIRALREKTAEASSKSARSRLYDEAVVQTLTILWEVADRICGKRLKPAIPALVEAMERHGHWRWPQRSASVS